MHKFGLSKILHSIGYVHTHTYQGRSCTEGIYKHPGVNTEWTKTKKAYRKRQLWSYNAPHYFVYIAGYFIQYITYQSMVGSVLYAAMAKRPDIAHAMGAVSKFNSRPTEAHLISVKRILRYLRGTINLTLNYHKLPKTMLTTYVFKRFGARLSHRLNKKFMRTDDTTQDSEETATASQSSHNSRTKL